MRGKVDIRKGKEEYTPPNVQYKFKIDEMTKALDILTSKLAKLEIESKNLNKGKQEGFQRNFNHPYKMFNQPTPIL